MAKLTLSEITLLALKNHFPLELVPGKTEKSHRFHCLVNHPDFPELSLVFGDELHGYLFDSAWIRLITGEKLRVSEADVRELFETSVSVPRWTREMPAADGPKSLQLTPINVDLGIVMGIGNVTKSEPGELTVAIPRTVNSPYTHLVLKTNAQLYVDTVVNFTGKFHLNGKLTDVEFN